MSTLVELAVDNLRTTRRTRVEKLWRTGCETAAQRLRNRCAAAAQRLRNRRLSSGSF